MSDTNIEDILEFEVDQAEYLQIVNGLRTPSQAIDFKKLLDYMSEQNYNHCDNNNLCKTCHSELQEVKESRGEHFGTDSYERMIICPRCG